MFLPYREERSSCIPWEWVWDGEREGEKERELEYARLNERESGEKVKMVKGCVHLDKGRARERE